MVHRRELDGVEIVLGNQGALWGNAMTWWDHDTGSVWSQPLGEAIMGPRTGARLELLSSTLTPWGAWRAAHPDTLALDAPAGNSGFALEGMMVAVELDGEAAAYRFTDLWERGPANDVVAGVPLAVVTDPADPQRWAVFSRRLDDRVVTLEIEGGRLVDGETHTVWDPVRGTALEGPLVGERLDLLPGFTVFPSEYPTFWPEGKVWSP